MILHFFSGVAAPAACGGIVGRNQVFLSVEDTYIASVYDVYSNDDVQDASATQIANTFGFYPPGYVATKTKQNNNEAGQIVGDT